MEMDIDFPALMKDKSDEAIQKYIDDYTKYRPEAIEAAIDELRNRGRVFSTNELEKLTQLPQLQRENIEQREKELSEGYELDTNVVTDETAPLLYSQNAVAGCSVFFGAITGAVLLTINIRRLKSSKGIVPALIFGSLYTLLQALIVYYILSGLPIEDLRILNAPLAVGGLGGIILSKLFWDRYIGKDKKYRST